MSVNLRKPSPRTWRPTVIRLAKWVGFLALTLMAFDSAYTRRGPAIAVAAPLIAYLALAGHLAHHRHHRRQNGSQGRRP